MSRKKPTIKELNKTVLENRHGINIAFEALDELKVYMSGLDRLLDWYVEYKGDIDGFKEFIKENKSPEPSDNADGAKDSLSDKQQDISKEKSSDKVSKKSK
tara:strand:+ start:1868 stop:2170 length:303 start_codon:yes stop_codon:yes gene_type:complete